MSFSPFGPDWGGASTAPITIGGEYDGTHGSGDLTFEARNSGTRGVDDIRIRVYDPGGNTIQNVRVRSGDALNQQYDLRNGLSLTLGNGDVTNRDTATIQIRDDLGMTVNPNNPLGGIRNSNPNLQFGGPSIVDGQFSINGETISVATTDTLGSAGIIDRQGDTSNFLAATKLNNVNVVDGIDPDTEKATDQVADALAEVFGDLNDVLKGPAYLNARLGSALRGAIGDSFGTETFGMNFNDTAGARQRGDAVSSLLADHGGQSGLVNGLLLAARQALTTVNSTLNIRDTLIETYA